MADGWMNTATTDPYDLAGIARRDQKAYETWRDSQDDDGQEMTRLFNDLGVKPIKQEFNDEF